MLRRGSGDSDTIEKELYSLGGGGTRRKKHEGTGSERRGKGSEAWARQEARVSAINLYLSLELLLCGGHLTRATHRGSTVAILPPYRQEFMTIRMMRLYSI